MGKSMSVIPTGQGSKEIAVPSQSIESSEINQLVQIDHQKICMTDCGYNQNVNSETWLSDDASIR